MITALYSADLIKELNEDFYRVAPFAMEYHETTDKQDYVSKKIRDFYFGDRQIDESTKDEVTNVSIFGVELKLWFFKEKDF